MLDETAYAELDARLASVDAELRQRRFEPYARQPLHTLAVPQPGPSEIIIAVHTAGVGIWDAAIRQGEWRAPGRS